ncbi:MAG TPA: diadenylate cyclase [Longimicrobiaceae bacterium]|nr:diadenylate cyclase [Longimicrobiaceae bacterium]
MRTACPRSVSGVRRPRPGRRSSAGPRGAWALTTDPFDGRSPLRAALFPGAVNLLWAVHVSDVIDVLLLAAFLFTLITWVRRSSSGSAARRVSALGIVYALVYLLAEHFDLYLMTQLLRVLFFVLLIALVLVFQTDIRRLLDRLATWKFARSGPRTAAHSPVGVLASAAEKLAESRTGALIAIRGEDAWGSQVTGGVELDGLISRPLIESLFDPSSAGHDGAVLIERDRITRFAAHLPLSTRVPGVSRFGGTRHAAALGLSEVRDALVVVVSEERGTVSVAQDGVLTELESPGELGPRLHAFWNAHYGSAAAGASGLNRRTAESAAAALGIAILSWVLFSYSGNTVSRSYQVPIGFRNLPVEWALDTDSVPSATVTVSGSERTIGSLDASKLSISVDLARPHPGVNRIPITDQNVNLPPAVQLEDVTPEVASVVARRLLRAELPVRVRTTAPLADSIRLRTVPSTLSVLVPAGEHPPAALLTEPVDTARLDPGAGVRAAVVLPAGLRLYPDEKPEVSVRVAR